MTEDGRVTRWAGQRDKRRAEVVDAAIEAIRAHGPGVSTEQIAARAGVARTRLYRHFTGAEDLYDAVARGAAEQIIDRVVASFARPDGSAREIITRSVRAYVDWLIDNVDLYRYVVLRAVDVRSGREPIIADVRAAISAPLRSMLADYLGLFERDPRIADPVAFGVTGLVEAATNRWLAEPGPMDIEAFVDNVSGWVWGVLETVLRGIGIDLDPDAPLPALAGESPA